MLTLLTVASDGSFARLAEEALAILAIALAFWHGVKLRQQLDVVKGLAASLRSVESQLPTQRLGQFPTFLSHIVRKIRAAKRSITIFCDYPAYGSFSDPETFRRYHRAIEDKIEEKKRVTIACLGEKERAQCFRVQETRDLQSWKTYKERRRPAFQKYLDFHACKETVDELTNDAFINYIIAEDNQAAYQHYRGAQILDVHARPTVYFWLIDDEVMIFVIPSATRLDEYGFYTQDPHLIASLKEIAGAFSPFFLGDDDLATSIGTPAAVWHPSENEPP
jgi:hypothetical protein